MRLDDMVGIGYKNTDCKFADYEIWKKENSRILYDPVNNKVLAEYNINSRQGKEFKEQPVIE